MRSALAALAFAAGVFALPQGITEDIAPSEDTPAGCATDYPTFAINVVNVTAAQRKMAKRQTNTLQIKLVDGVLTDASGATGYIAANHQFQFDDPVQTGAIYTAGFSVCANGTLALGDSAIWYQCLSGTFYNLYDENVAAQCSPIYLQALEVDGAVSTSTASASTATGAASAATSAVTTTASVASSITDGQIQGPTTGGAITSSVQVVASTTVSVSTSSAAILSSITDGQIQGPTSAGPISSTVEIVSESTSFASVTTSVAIISSINDGQIQAPTSASATVSSVVIPFTGAASMPTMAAEMVLAVAGVAAIFL